MNIRALALLASCCALAGCSSPTPSAEPTPPAAAAPAPKPRSAAAKIETLGDFEASTFCQAYKCVRDGGWDINTGGSNHTYDIAFEEAGVEVQTAADSDKVTGLGISFVMRKTLAPSEVAAIEALLASVDTTRPTAPAMRSIRRNITRPLGRYENVYDAGGKTPFGSYRASSAKVGRDYVLALERQD